MSIVKSEILDLEADSVHLENSAGSTLRQRNNCDEGFVHCKYAIRLEIILWKRNGIPPIVRNAFEPFEFKTKVLFDGMTNKLSKMTHFLLSLLPLDNSDLSYNFRKLVTRMESKVNFVNWCISESFAVKYPNAKVIHLYIFHAQKYGELYSKFVEQLPVTYCTADSAIEEAIKARCLRAGVQTEQPKSDEFHLNPVTKAPLDENKTSTRQKRLALEEEWIPRDIRVLMPARFSAYLIRYEVSYLHA